MPSLLQRQNPASAIDVQALPGSAPCEQVGEAGTAVSAVAAHVASVMTGSLATRAAWGSGRSDAEHRDASTSNSQVSSILSAILRVIFNENKKSENR